MADTGTIRDALQALDACDAALRTLDLRCCEPGRSPSMKRLASTLSDARQGIAELNTESQNAASAIESLEDAGAQVGRLQVGCCAPNRLSLYVELLEGLTVAQLEVNGSLGRGH